MKPKPLLTLNHLTVPVAIVFVSHQNRHGHYGGPCKMDNTMREPSAAKRSTRCCFQRRGMVETTADRVAIMATCPLASPPTPPRLPNEMSGRRPALWASSTDSQLYP